MAKVSVPMPPPFSTRRNIRLWLLRVWRAGVLIGLVLLIQSQSRWLAAHHRVTISLSHAKKFFPGADRVRLRDPARGLHYVTDSRGNTLGVLLTTSPETDEIIGY